MGVGMAGVGGVAGAAQLSQQRAAIDAGGSVDMAAAEAEASALLNGDGSSDVAVKEGDRQDASTHVKVYMVFSLIPAPLSCSRNRDALALFCVVFKNSLLLTSQVRCKSAQDANCKPSCVARRSELCK